MVEWLSDDVCVVQAPQRLEGELAVPGDKSISHRALILNAIAEGKAEVRDFLPSEDCLATLACLRNLDAEIEWSQNDPNRVTVAGRGLDGLKEPASVLDAANSGTTMRLLAGLLAGRPFLSILTGDASLRTRPMARVIVPLRQMGAHIHASGGDAYAPLAILGGALNGIDYQIPVASAQVKSALLLAGLQAQGSTTIHSPAVSRDHTERMLSAMGAKVAMKGATVRIEPLDRPLQAMDVTVPGDISSAAFWLVAGCLHPNARVTVCGVGVNPTRSGILEALGRMGAKVRVEHSRQESGEPVADITVESSLLCGTELGGDLIPRLIDELPVLAVAASVARGITVIRDAAELRVKETDRIAAVVSELTALGGRVEERPDGLVIEGVSQLRGARVRSYGDHRLAMAWAVAALVADGETEIEGANVVSVSYPRFWADLETLEAEVPAYRRAPGSGR